MKKSDRQALLTQIVAQNTVETQEELLNLLASAGVQATQATISRDIRELRIVKARNAEGQTYYHLYQEQAIDADQHLTEMMQDMVSKVDRVQFMTIIHTTTGTADLIADLLDALNSPEIVATLAGTNTALLISPDETAAQAIYDKINEMIAKK
ncbi:arginine repressor [Enterococcus nangangensis]|uniref:arginine repressor n=1 Tax=Enterococcus nangangensis TaxID=2559926 RepID=UPI0010F433AE|nr:arginine repressor [Enterococcus nangangensis]